MHHRKVLIAEERLDRMQNPRERIQTLAMTIETDPPRLQTSATSGRISINLA